jgi:hypothetical protein
MDNKLMYNLRVLVELARDLPEHASYSPTHAHL